MWDKSPCVRFKATLSDFADALNEYFPGQLEKIKAGGFDNDSQTRSLSEFILRLLSRQDITMVSQKFGWNAPVLVDFIEVSNEDREMFFICRIPITWYVQSWFLPRLSQNKGMFLRRMPFSDFRLVIAMAHFNSKPYKRNAIRSIASVGYEVLKTNEESYVEIDFALNPPTGNDVTGRYVLLLKPYRPNAFYAALEFPLRYLAMPESEETAEPATT